MPSLPTGPTPRIDLGEVSEFTKHISKLLAGLEPTTTDDDYVYVYRTPKEGLIHMYPDLAETDYGRIEYRDGIPKIGNRAIIQISNDPEDAAAFVSELTHRTHALLQKLTPSATALERERYDDGGLGFMRKRLKDLLDQLLHEHYRQRDRAKTMPTTPE